MTTPYRQPVSGPGAWHWACRLVAVLCELFGLLFLVGGGYLASLGGSLYFVIAGIAMLAAGVLLWRGQIGGAWLYGLALVGSAVWAVWDAGWNFWPLVSRLFALGAL